MLGGTDATELYAGFSAPVFPFSYLVALTLVALPLAIWPAPIGWSGFSLSA